MNRKLFTAALFLSAPVAALWAAGCGDDEVFRDTDAADFDGGGLPETGPNPQTDASDSSTGLGCGNATGTPQRLLLSINNATTSELAAFNVADKKVDGRLTYPGFIGLTSSLGSDPYLLEQATDVVARLDAKKPWEIISSWNVAGDDKVDGGRPNANPATVVVPDCGKGYVLRFNRNKIAVIDTTKVADAGAPESFIDLAPLLQANDKDGFVEMTSALYVPSKKRIYVLLGNIDLTKVATDGFTALCADTKPTIIAIDTTTGQLASLGGTGPGGGIALDGYNPPLGTPLWYDGRTRSAPRALGRLQHGYGRRRCRRDPEAPYRRGRPRDEGREDAPRPRHQRFPAGHGVRRRYTRRGPLLRSGVPVEPGDDLARRRDPRRPRFRRL